MYKRVRKYPISIIIFLIICYLSFFRPPSVGVPNIPHLDKVIHFLMYFGFSSILWVEFLRVPKRTHPKKGWVIAFYLPILISGLIELLQEYCTTYRGGEWLDFLANSMGALVASLLFFIVFRKSKLF